MELIALACLLGIAGASMFEARVGVAAPLVLVAGGIALSLTGLVSDFEVPPEIVLNGVLPPLLYASAVSMPPMSLRREFRSVGGLSIVLVALSAVIVGLVFQFLIPGLGFGWGVALGAIISPTDAVATKIAARCGVRSRVASVLSGESLLNDASALVLLRSAVAAAGAAVSIPGVVGDFALSVAIAVVVGFAVGHANLWVRSKTTDPTVNTLISFTVPFLAALPTEALGASGLLAAVFAGLTGAHHGPRMLSPGHRLSDSQNWQTVELGLEGAVFLAVGLQASALIADVEASATGLGAALGLAALAFGLVLAVRAAYVVPLIYGARRLSRRAELIKPKFDAVRERLEDPDRDRSAPFEVQGRKVSKRRTKRFEESSNRISADLDYYIENPLDARDGGVVVWAGMRGAVTLAAAQTLPADTPERSLIVFIAFAVAVGSLLIQGLTLPAVVRRLREGEDDHEARSEEFTRLMAMLREAAANADEETPGGLRAVKPIGRDGGHAAANGHADEPDAEILGELGPDELRDRFDAKKLYRLRVLRAQREAVLDARDDGAFSAEALDAVLDALDADEVGLELKGGPVEEFQPRW